MTEEDRKTHLLMAKKAKEACLRELYKLEHLRNEMPDHGDIEKEYRVMGHNCLFLDKEIEKYSKDVYVKD